MKPAGPFTTVTVRHYEAMLGVVRAAKEVAASAVGADGRTVILPVGFLERLRERLANWDREK